MKKSILLSIIICSLLIMWGCKKEVVNLFSSFTRSISNIGYYPFSIVEKVSRTSFLIIGNNCSIVANGIYTSPDGINWTKKFNDDGLGNTLRSVVWTESQFVAVGKLYNVIVSP